MQTAFLKFIDNYLGRLAIAILRPQPPCQIVDPETFLFIRPGGIGDAALSIPTIRSINERYPTALVTVLAEKRNASVFKLSPHVDRVLMYDRPMELLAAIRGKYDVVIDTEQWHRLSAVVARLTGAPVSLGYASNERRRLFSHPVLYSHDDYEADNFLKLVEPFGSVAVKAESPFLMVSEEAANKAESLLTDFGKKPFVAIFPGSSVPEKRWSISNFAMLARKLDLSGNPIVLIGSKQEKTAGEAICFGVKGLNLAGKTSLVETAAIIDRAAVVVSGDSGVLHIAAGLGRPTISLFGPSNAKKWAPRGNQHIIVSKNMPCSPCSKFGYTPKCPMNANCMSGIEVEEVYAAVVRLVKDRA